MQHSGSVGSTHRVLGPLLPWTKRVFLCYPSHFTAVQLRRKASPFTHCYCQVSFALLIRHVFQVLIITVFMLITSTAPSAKFHTHKHQLPSLFLKAKSQLSHWGTRQRWSRQGRCRHRACMVQPHAGAVPKSQNQSPLPWLPCRNVPQTPQGLYDTQEGAEPTAAPASFWKKGSKWNNPSAGARPSDGRDGLKLPVNIYRAFAKALRAQPNFNHEIDRHRGRINGRGAKEGWSKGEELHLSEGVWHVLSNMAQKGVKA